MLPRIHELNIVWCLAFGVSLTVMLIFKSNRYFLIPYYYFLIIYFFATKARRHKVTRRLFVISSIKHPLSSIQNPVSMPISI